MSRTVFLALVAALLATAVVFALWPQLDLEAARLFVTETGFRGRSAQERLFRSLFYGLPLAVMAIMLALAGARRLGAPIAERWAPSGRSLVFLLATLALGPGLLVNLVLKDHSHRPRPAQTREFGGALEFRPWWRFDGGCAKNCSFVSGETSASFWLVAPAALAPPPFTAPAVAGAALIGAVTAVGRMAFGGHYLSDVLFAALLTLLIVGAGWRLLMRGGR